MDWDWWEKLAVVLVVTYIVGSLDMRLKRIESRLARILERLGIDL